MIILDLFKMTNRILCTKTLYYIYILVNTWISKMLVLTYTVELEVFRVQRGSNMSFIKFWQMPKVYCNDDKDGMFFRDPLIDTLWKENCPIEIAVDFDSFYFRWSLSPAWYINGTSDLNSWMTMTPSTLGMVFNSSYNASNVVIQFSSEKDFAFHAYPRGHEEQFYAIAWHGDGEVKPRFFSVNAYNIPLVPANVSDLMNHLTKSSDMKEFVERKNFTIRLKHQQTCDNRDYPSGIIYASVDECKARAHMDIQINETINIEISESVVTQITEVADDYFTETMLTTSSNITESVHSEITEITNGEISDSITNQITETTNGQILEAMVTTSNKLIEQTSITIIETVESKMVFRGSYFKQSPAHADVLPENGIAWTIKASLLQCASICVSDTDCKSFFIHAAENICNGYSKEVCETKSLKPKDGMIHYIPDV